MRFLVFAVALGFASASSGEPPKQPSEATNASGAKPAPIHVAITEVPAAQDAGCKKGETKRDSDLCAQWEAAEASRNAANYSFWAVLISAVGTGFLFFTFLQARRTSRAELRAYLFTEVTAIYDGSHLGLNGTNEEMLPRASITLRNFGQTPAHDVKHWGAMILIPNQEDFEPPEPDMGICAGGLFAPNASQLYTRLLTANPLQPEMANVFCFTDDAIEDIRQARLQLMIFGRITYKDVFRKKRNTTYRMFHTGTWPPPDGASPPFATRGNKSD